MDLEEQQRIIHELDLRAGGLAARERVVERMIGASFLVAATALALSGDLAPVSMLAVAGAVLAFVVAGRVEFDMSGGFAVPTQLAFIPMLFVVPASLLPLAVGLAWLLTRLPDVIGGRVSPERVWVTVGNGWLSLGPALLLILAGAQLAALIALLLGMLVIEARAARR